MEKTKLIKDMEVRNIERIFAKPEAPMEIPEYQRTYAWNNEEINDFISDLKNLQISRSAQNPRTHFMGGIVVFEEEKYGNIPKKIHHIIDGQQRLLTFQIVFSVIKHHYKALQEKFSKAKNNEFAQRAANKIKEIEGFFIVQVTDMLGDQHNVDTLKPSQMDRDVYTKVLESTDDKSDEATESHKRLRKARNKLNKDLVSLCKKDGSTDEQYFETLGVLLECIKIDCQIIYIVCPNLSDAYELFQVLNDRGKSLTDGDLLRAHTFKLISEFGCSDVDTNELILYWDEMLADSDANVKHFLEQYFRVVIPSGNPQKRQLYRQYQEDIFKKPDDTLSNKNKISLIKKSVKDMRDWYRTFSQLCEGEWPYEDIHSAIEDYDRYRLKLLIKVLDLKNISILMAAAQKTDQLTFRELVFVIEKFFFRYLTICGGNADTVGSTFGDFAHRIWSGSFLMSDLQNVLQKLIDSEASDSIFTAQLRLSLVYKDGKAKQIIRYFLTYIEHHRKLFLPGLSHGDRKVEKTPVHIVERSSSVEHIYPQNPVVKKKDIEEDKSRGDLTNCLGNLTFLSRDDNTTLGNADYPIKKVAFASSMVWLNTHIARTYNDWTAANIIDYEMWLIDRAIEFFKIK
jgi:uncharacterized protein with ParB-like and HNH nuclease domain